MSANDKLRKAPPAFDFDGWTLKISLVHHRGDPNKLPPIEIAATESISRLQLASAVRGDPRGLFGRILNGLANRLFQYMGTKYDFNGREPVPVEQPEPRRPSWPPGLGLGISSSPSGEQTDTGSGDGRS